MKNKFIILLFIISLILFPKFRDKDRDRKPRASPSPSPSGIITSSPWIL